MKNKITTDMVINTIMTIKEKGMHITTLTIKNELRSLHKDLFITQSIVKDVVNGLVRKGLLKVISYGKFRIFDIVNYDPVGIAPTAIKARKTRKDRIHSVIKDSYVEYRKKDGVLVIGYIVDRHDCDLKEFWEVSCADDFTSEHMMVGAAYTRDEARQLYAATFNVNFHDTRATKIKL